MKELGGNKRSRRSVQAEILSEKGVIMRRPLLRCGLPHPAVSSSSLPEEDRRGQHPLHFQPLAHLSLTLLNPEQSSDPAQALQSEVSLARARELWKREVDFHTIYPQG